MAFGSARHTYAFDALRRNTGYIDPDGGRATWSFDAASQMTEQVNPNGTATTWAYEARGLTSGIRHRKSDGSTLGVDLYEWDANANPTRKVTLGGSNTWGYDVIDQLTSEQHELGIVATWQYDPCSNRSQQDRTQAGVRTVTNYVHDAANQISTATEGAAITTFTHDANGNMSGEVSAAGRVTYLWNPRDLQTGYCPPSGQIATFTHRYDDLRASIDPGDGNPATKLVWDPRGSSGYTDLLAETKADQSVPRQYWRGAHLVTFKEVGEKCVYACDHLGSTECLLDEAQGVAAAYQMSAWGEVLTETGVEQCFKFGGDWGAYCDALSRDLWMRARVMAPGLGRFLSADIIVWVTLRYLYTGNRPVLLSDPSGLQATFRCYRRQPLPPRGTYGPWPGWDVERVRLPFTYIPGQGWSGWNDIPARPADVCEGQAWDTYCSCLIEKYDCCDSAVQRLATALGGSSGTLPPPGAFPRPGYTIGGSDRAPTSTDRVDPGGNVGALVDKCMNQIGQSTANFPCAFDCWGRAVAVLQSCRNAKTPPKSSSGSRAGQRCRP
jgi:RHS repeat-associated protein